MSEPTEPVKPTEPTKANPKLTPEQFLKLVGDVTSTETFDVTFTDGAVYKFKQLTSNQLKSLVKAIVDSPLTQTEFNTAIFEIMQQSSFDANQKFLNHNTVDRLLFCIATRAFSLSPVTVVTAENGTQATADLLAILQKLNAVVTENKDLFTDKTSTKNAISLTYGLPSLKVENQVNKEVYKNKNFNIEDSEELRNLLGETFINELAKCLKTAKIGEQTIDFSEITFNNRLKIIETLPANLIQEIIVFIENYKKVLEDSITIAPGIVLPIDGSLFTSR